ncbi:MAG: GTP-binding protein [Candidatus Methanoperedens nitroreducens]|uniref:GTP-binding protein n=1 Tax=Candidatus Methanoperedens nitratireducens TaxID=1392998 RepID=A0A0P7ZD27_9EURY|nr:NOG1 family protein [Candidatus Methanoperedens sp. BLZ2]KAB2947131.1 MAG: NOG1 family protein [Candidatus Methanoperedens sp.]KPQ41387.1 MAG: GTP-binding protein [Candidatus Methanoperedens sp. BLZ1]MBZ0174231.1 NOG1 family protein [Candidatus Methanoperedens nitroreducens]CAG0973325.1 GTPase Obg [Methanosarcinales archaeon]MCX9077748.1 NOG1 family protein [Candidatus Methanoperedens sp.]
MIFEKIPTVPTAEELLDKSYRRATRAKRGKQILDRKSKLQAEESMLLTAANILSDNLAHIVRKFPSLEQLPPFYLELAEVMVGVEEMKMNLASVQWAGEKIGTLARKYVGMMREADDSKVVRKQAFGRISSIVASIDGNLRFLNEARNKLRKLPAIDEGPTIVVAGYPNVGKSSFVALVSSARPEIAPYPFTTKGLAVGHFTRNNIRHQVIDTPGLLDRPLEVRNEIELQAITALKHVGKVILYVIDPSETCGYSLDTQMHLLEEIKNRFPVPFLIVANKKDISATEIGDMSMSTLTGEGVDAVLERLLEMMPIIDPLVSVM